VAPFGPVLGKDEVHFGIVQDMRRSAVQARFLLNVLNWLHDVHVAHTDRVWVSGWSAHAHDLTSAGATRPELEPLLDWVVANFVGQTVGGQVAATFAGVPEARDVYYAWEVAHPGAVSFGYSPTYTDWSQYPYLAPAAWYLGGALYGSTLPAQGTVRWHALTASVEAGGPYTLRVAYTTDGIPTTVDLSGTLGGGQIAAVDPATGAATTVPTNAVPVPAIGAILVPPEKVLAGAPADRYQPATVHDVDLLADGHLLVTDGGTAPDRGDSGVFEIDRDGRILWSYATGLNFAHNADQQPDGRVIISDTGHDRVIIIDAGGTIVWNSDAVTLGDGSHLNYPNDANLLPSGNLLITDRDNHRVIEITPGGTVVWQFGQTGVPGTGPARLNGPHNADRLTNGNTVIADSNNKRILEVNPAHQIVWSYAVGLNWPRDADRLTNGNTLINDSNNRRIIEVTPAGSIVWLYTVDDLSYDSDRLENGNTLLGSGARILEVDAAGATVWSYPPLNTTEVWITNPTSGVDLYGHIHRPVDFDPQGVYPGIVLLPGGSGTGTSFDQQNRAQHFADQGLIVMHFDPDGRGLSTNGGSYTQEDYCGYLHQDGLRAVVQHLISLPETDDNNIGLVSYSYGVTMGAGMLGRYWYNPPVKFFIEWEGPADRSDTEQPNGHVPTGFDDAWWFERQPVNFISHFRGYFLPVQSEIDHVQPDNQHTFLLTNLATHTRYGGSGRCLWTRVNSASGWTQNAPNTVYLGAKVPDWLPESVVTDSAIAQYLDELTGMPALPAPGDLNQDGNVDQADFELFTACATGPALGPATGTCIDADFDHDTDIDQSDFGTLQRCYSSEHNPADPHCAE